MHGRPRKAPSPEDESALALKSAKLRTLQSQFLQFHHQKIYTKEALEISAKLLEINPECYTAWNYRKLGVEHNLNRSDENETDPEFIKSVFNEELKVSESALRKNFKSYGAWHHRKWVLSKGHSSIDREFKLLEAFQKSDGRNFHAWDCRRFVAASINKSDEEELQFTANMINTNFSNYSAWHNRSVLLSHLLEKKAEGFFPREKVLTDEYDLVHQALFTDPDDQSGWFYHLWLLEQTVKVKSLLLVSSWPAHGAELHVSTDNCLGNHPFHNFTMFDSDNGKFPLMLYFNEAVEGVNSSTITVEYDSNGDLIWTPLSTNVTGGSQAWVTYLNIPDSSQAYPVKVSLGNSRGIVSCSGFHYTQPSSFAFTVGIQPRDSEHPKRPSMEMISWREENFHVIDTHFEESSDIKSFEKLKIHEDNEPIASEWNLKTVANEIALFRELLAEINCKIGKLTLARLLTAHDAMMSYHKATDSYKMAHSEEVLELYRELVLLDPPHSQYYKDESSLVLLRQVTSSSESLLRHCYHYADSTSSSFTKLICTQLSNLSLSRIGSTEKLLWVQMLDLSHNQLHSIEGLEALQLLSCLNLSNNRLGSFTALEPLRLLESLKVLDISHNEIGAHSVDTRRYVCSSPLSHTEGSDWNFGEYQIGEAKVENYWEAYLIFRGMNLTQLDIVGNAICDEKFKLFLFKLLPSVKWLDGQQLH